MKKQNRWILVLMLGAVIILTGCPPATAIGDVTKITATVQAGQSNALQIVDPSRSLYSGDSIKVSGGHGHARVSLVNNTVIIDLYDNTDSSTSVTGSQQALAYLQQGGLKVSVSEGSTCTVNVPSGGTFYIIGTEAFVLYNPETKFTTAGNFKGTVKWDSADMKDQILEPGTMIDVDPNGIAAPPLPLPFGIEEFNQIVAEVGSPIDTMQILRENYGLPQPGDTMPPAFGKTLLIMGEGTFLPSLVIQWQADETNDPDWIFTHTLRQDVTLVNGEPFNAPFVTKTLIENAAPDMLTLVEIYPVDDYTFAIRYLPRQEANMIVLKGDQVRYWNNILTTFEFDVKQ